ncbi:DinB family protein [Mucilaginibacter sp. AW1-3]
MNRPQPWDYNPFYATYIDKIGDADIVESLIRQHNEVNDFLKAIPKDKALYAYADGKWTLNEAIGHMIDTERIMTYRLLRFARNDQNPLPGFEQEDYIANARFNQMQMDDLISEFYYLRKANLYLFKSLNADEQARTGTASNNRVTVNALLYIIAGHVEHHIRIIKERYL